MAFPNGADLDIERVTEDAGSRHPHNRNNNLNNLLEQKIPAIADIAIAGIHISKTFTNLYKPQRDAAGISEVTPVSGCG